MADLKYELTKQDEATGNDSSPGVTYAASEKQQRPRFKPRQKTCAIIIICILAFIVFLLLIGIIVIGVQLHKAKQNQVTSPCLSVNCINTVSDLVRSMDRTVEPCNDFYQYACGKWTQENPKPESKPSWDPIKQLAYQNEEKIKKLIVREDIRVRYAKNKAIQKVFDLYDSCSNENAIEAAGATPLMEVINSLGSCPGLNSTWNESSWDLNSVVLKINKNYSPYVFFRLWVYSSESNSSVNEITLSPGGLTLALSRYNSTVKRNIEIKEAYKSHILRLLKLIGLNQNQSNEMMESIFSTEKALAALRIQARLTGRSQEDEGPTTIKEMDTDDQKTQISWLSFFQQLFQDTDFKPTENTKISVDSRSYFKALNRFLYETPKSDLANYITWILINHYSSLLSKPFRQSLPTFYKVFRGKILDIPRWEICLAEVKACFGMAIGRMFVDEVFRNGSKAEVSEMVDDIKEVFISDFDQVEWMDAQTKAVAKEKAKAMAENVGYPEFIMDNKELANLYKEIDVRNNTYFLNLRSIEKSDKMEMFEKMGNPVNKKKWGIFPATVNAVYVIGSNSIDIPAGILQRPMFKDTYTSSINFGGIGSIVGHEMTHGFDNIGRKYNQKGNVKKWWSNSSIANFNKNTKCFVNQYSNLTFMGMSLDGEGVLAEVIADNGGTEIAFKAYKMWEKANGKEPMLPGINLSHEQIFFLSYAQIFCASYTKNSAREMIRRASHPINPLRVKGVMINSKEFSKAYKCPVGSPMNPAKKCKIW